MTNIKVPKETHEYPFSGGIIPKGQKVRHLSEILEQRKPNINRKYMIFEKIDGIYGFVDWSVQDQSWGFIKSSANRVILSMEGFDKFLPTPSQMDDITVDTRLIFEICDLDDKYLDFHTLNGLINRHEVYDNSKIMIHDMVDLSPSNKGFIDRYMDLVALMFDNNYDRVEICKPITSIDNLCDELDDCYSVFEEITQQGGEGIILKAYKGAYSWGNKRNADLMKLKREITLDLEVIDVVRTVGKKKKKSISAILRRVSGKEVRIVVNNKELVDLTKEHGLSFLIGKVVLVSAMGELSTGMLREPTIKSIRWDKDICDLVD